MINNTKRTALPTPLMSLMASEWMLMAGLEFDFEENQHEAGGRPEATAGAYACALYEFLKEGWNF